MVPSHAHHNDNHRSDHPICECRKNLGDMETRSLRQIMSRRLWILVFDIRMWTSGGAEHVQGNLITIIYSLEYVQATPTLLNSQKRT
jgi:hypothetical protein